MTPKELFTVGARLLGVWFAISRIPEILARDYMGAATGIAGLILITRADLIANFCYPKESTKIDVREEVPKDFRDS